MSEPLPPPASSPALDDDDDAEDALLFARCSQAPADATASADAKAKNAASGRSKDERRGHPVPQPSPRRSRPNNRHLVISLAASILIGLALLFIGVLFYLSSVRPRLAKVEARLSDSTVSVSPAPAAPASTAATASTDAALKEELAKSAEQITALQKQVDVMRREQLLMQQTTRESLENISTTLKNPQLVPPPVAPLADQPGIPRMADVKPEISPTQQEFIQLKERNRLTQYADEAIATGTRRPLEVLIEYMRDPQGPHLHDAAKAEFMRAVRSIQILQREDPGYRLPVAELFKDSGISAEADVPPEALLKLLADHQQPWEVRVRVCFLLLGSALPETNAQLIKAIKEDPSLDVAKHAQLTLEQRIKKRFRIFDIPAIEEWFKSQEK